jgi:hypothetical protein
MPVPAVPASGAATPPERSAGTAGDDGTVAPVRYVARTRSNRPAAAANERTPTGGPTPGAASRPAAAPRRRRGRRSALIALVVVVGLALAAAAVAVVVSFLSAEPGSRPAGGSSSPADPPPIDLQLRDQGTSVTLTWTDPSGGRVSFVVAYGHADKAADRTQRVEPGTTSITINGLNPGVNYCFTVAGIQSATTIALSRLACTQRSGSAAPSGSP